MALIVIMKKQAEEEVEHAMEGMELTVKEVIQVMEEEGVVVLVQLPTEIMEDYRQVVLHRLKVVPEVMVVPLLALCLQGIPREGQVLRQEEVVVEPLKEVARVEWVPMGKHVFVTIVPLIRYPV